MTPQQRHEREKEDAKTSNDFARVGAQAAILINGGAASAILAFISGASRSSACNIHSLSQALPYALIAYVVGVFFSAVSLPIASVAIENYMAAWGGDKDAGPRGTRYWYITLACIAIGLVCFLGASVYLALALRNGC